MQGVFVNGHRPKSKKAVKEALAANPASVEIEATSMLGDEYNGPVSRLPVGAKVYFAGPDPYTTRDFYGTIERKGDKVVCA